MKAILGRANRTPVLAPGMFATLLLAANYAECACPEYVSLPSGTVFNIAGLIRDAGSPDGALRKARSAVAQISARGGCPQSEELAVCEETLAVARKAIAALEACVSSDSLSESLRKKERAAVK